MGAQLIVIGDIILECYRALSHLESGNRKPKQLVRETCNPYRNLGFNMLHLLCY